VEDHEITSADSSCIDLQQDVVISYDWFSNVLEFDKPLSSLLLDKCFQLTDSSRDC